MKRMYTVIALLLLCLGIGYFQKGNQPANKISKPRVGVLTLMHHPALDQIYAGFRKQMAREGYRDGKNVTIAYQNAQGDQSNLQMMAHKLVSDRADVLFGITTPASQALANSTTKIPVVLGAVTNPQGAGLVKNNQRPGANITGVSDRAPIKEQFRLILKFLPHVKTLGIIYTSNDNSAVTEEAEFVKEAKRHNVELKAYSIANSNDLNQVSQQMLTEVEGVIVTTDNTVAGAMQTLVKNADAVHKPIFPAVDTMVKQGGVAAYSINQYRLGEESGKLTAAILRGDKKPATTAIRYLKHGEPVLNLKQAQKLGLKIPADFQKEAETSGKVFH
ncbi:ABC transporter substrate-binding protein [Lactobacillus sp. DCY120]|uniref:ABC transporter substrate-binding protein n=1 Tax=Bombilactobacillus apium TaxID=2675299 RepID=A0A850R6H9_9LACO|nr:tryptophan ABC transporter substrate-binding protein [Bombilactobacillus apium]NVY96437.1 ABC transporter substrate-binding protein [Bombilactobacillus apium]